MKKVAFYTLGCKLNFSETSTIARQFEKKGFQRVDFDQNPDIYVINSCSVTENADKKCRKVVREALKVSPQAFITIVGCFAQLKPRDLSEIPGVDAVLGAAEKFQLIDYLDQISKDTPPLVAVSPIDQATSFNRAYSLNDRTRTFLKVQDGCNYNCTFCTIPLARGKSRSDTIDKVLANAREIGQSGVKEIVLTGVNIGDFGIQDDRRVENFVDLVKALETVDEIKRIRISSIEPNLLTDQIIDSVASSNRFVPHFHIPLQSGSDKVLKSMARRYRKEIYVNRIDRIKTLMPDCCIGADVIVGFPGEGEDEFLETFHFLNELDVSYLHVFTYSERPNTKAIKMEGSVPITVRNERSQILRNLSLKKRRKFYQEHIGQKRPVLFEETKNKGLMTGFTDNYIKVEAKYDPLIINEITDMQLASINGNGLVEVEEPGMVSVPN